MAAAAANLNNLSGGMALIMEISGTASSPGENKRQRKGKGNASSLAATPASSQKKRSGISGGGIKRLA